jgi:hypothetical protein
MILTVSMMKTDQERSHNASGAYYVPNAQEQKTSHQQNQWQFQIKI